MDEIADKLKSYAEIFRNIRSPDVAALLESAERKVRANETDVELAVELQVCAFTRDHLPEQRSVAALMRTASQALRPPAE